MLLMPDIQIPTVNLFFWQDYDDVMALSLVRWTILVDTVNLSQAAKKVTKLDVQVLEKIEDIIQVPGGDR